MKKEIAFFDFDGTITTKDTLLEFIRYSKGSFRFLLGFLINSPYLFAYKLKIISNQRAKEKVLQYFFNNMPVSHFNTLCNQFSVEKLPALIRPGAIEAIKKLQAQNCLVVIVSASPENWIRKWAKELNLALIATQLEEIELTITGKIFGVNCYGIEKVNRILKEYPLTEYTVTAAFGDTNGDIPMLNLAKNKYFKPFRCRN